jgi:hypothetical protein
VFEFVNGRWQVGRSLEKYDESDTDLLTPGDPEDPGDPDDPGDPEDPNDPGDPEDPSDPGDPEDPSDPGDPEDPGDPADPGDPGDPADPGDPGNGDPATVVLTATRQGAAGTLTATVAGGATDECDPLCSIEVAPGTSVTLRATADGVNAIERWTGVDGCGKDATCTVSVDDDRSVAVVFAGQVELTVTIDGEGTVTGSSRTINCPTTCTAIVPQGERVTLTADPAGQAEIGWGGDCGGTAATCLVTMDQDRSVSVTFAELVQLRVTTGGDGDGTVTSDDGRINCPGTCTITVSQDTQITLTADPAGFDEFSGWGGDGGCGGTAGTCTVRMDRDRTVSATFDEMFVLGIHFQGRSGGRVTGPGVDCGSDCVARFRPDTRITLTGEPFDGDGYGWAGPLGFECNEIPINTPCTFVMDETMDIVVNFFRE